MSDLIKQFREAQSGLVTQQSDFSLSAVVDMIEYNAIDIDPHYQRRDRWKPEKQSALIESFLMNVPVPPIYFSEDDYGSYSVIDGKQRLTAIKDFLLGNFALKSLDRFPVLNGYYFKDLPPPIQNALSVRPYIRVITLLQQSDPSLKYEVFLRLNTGGEKLRQQEIRNVAYEGPLNTLLYKLSDSAFLKQQLKIKSASSTAYRNMDDLEMVLRFFAISENWEYFGYKLAKGLDLYMANNRFAETEPLEGKFNRALAACEEIFGERAFQKPLESGWREQFIAPLYDAQMTAIAQLTTEEIDNLKSNKEELISSFRNLYLEDKEFAKSVNQATSDSSAINTRVSKLISLFRGVANG
ncbi:DUF262 domain-containing protein [Photobacterium damselae]|uniref:DUF262 domain-containing protein n=1 Tax=Photobacterium damselae TaxID=38293 RepID=UPI000E03F489|nr:DUF262 domain-containing protein [Photobacterium damselae]SUB91737.1 Uncharacterized conserved protein [Photobacterium damselae]